MRTLERSPADGRPGSHRLRSNGWEPVTLCGREWVVPPGEAVPGDEGLSCPLPGLPGLEAGAASPREEIPAFAFVPQSLHPLGRMWSHAVPSCSVCSHVFLMPLSFVSPAASVGRWRCLLSSPAPAAASPVPSCLLSLPVFPSKFRCLPEHSVP